MKRTKIVAIKPNYRKKVLEVTLRHRSDERFYELPFAAFRGLQIGRKNPFSEIVIEKDLNCQSARFLLKNGEEGDFPADFILYHCDPSYDWSPLNQLKKALKDKLLEAQISLRVLAKALGTSPSQIERLFQTDKASKHLVQLCKVAEVVGCRVEFKLEEKEAV